MLTVGGDEFPALFVVSLHQHASPITFTDKLDHVEQGVELFVAKAEVDHLEVPLELRFYEVTELRDDGAGFEVIEPGVALRFVQPLEQEEVLRHLSRRPSLGLRGYFLQEAGSVARHLVGVLPEAGLEQVVHEGLSHFLRPLPLQLVDHCGANRITISSPLASQPDFPSFQGVFCQLLPVIETVDQHEQAADPEGVVLDRQLCNEQQVLEGILEEPHGLLLLFLAEDLAPGLLDRRHRELV